MIMINSAIFHIAIDYFIHYNDKYTLQAHNNKIHFQFCGQLICFAYAIWLYWVCIWLCIVRKRENEWIISIAIRVVPVRPDNISICSQV